MQMQWQGRPVNRKPYPSDVSDEEWAFIAPYLTLLREDAAQREHRLREVFNGLRYVARGGIAWRLLPNDLPPWAAVYQRSISRRSAGSPPACSRPWSTTSGCCSGWPTSTPRAARGVTRTRRR